MDLLIDLSIGQRFNERLNTLCMFLKVVQATSTELKSCPKHGINFVCAEVDLRNVHEGDEHVTEVCTFTITAAAQIPPPALAKLMKKTKTVGYRTSSGRHPPADQQIARNNSQAQL